MENKKHIIIYSHGFGVRKDDCGLLSNIAENIPEAESILFDYFIVDEVNKTITTCKISEQVKKLLSVVEKTKQENPNAVIDIIAHSQGTIIAALANPKGIRKAILLAPVFDMSIERTVNRYSNRTDSKINLDGISILSPVEGLNRVIPKEYWEERKLLKTFEEYNKFSLNTEVVVIQANQDTILPKVDLVELSSKIKVFNLDGNHQFDGEARQLLLETIKDLV